MYASKKSCVKMRLICLLFFSHWFNSLWNHISIYISIYVSTYLWTWFFRWAILLKVFQVLLPSGYIYLNSIDLKSIKPELIVRCGESTWLMANNCNCICIWAGASAQNCLLIACENYLTSFGYCWTATATPHHSLTLTCHLHSVHVSCF